MNMIKMKQQYFSPESEVVELALKNAVLVVVSNPENPYEGEGEDW